MNVVVRVGDTIRRPAQPEGVRCLLRWYEQAGFEGAPRFFGIDERGRDILSFVEGDPAFAPVPAGDDVVAEIGNLLRRAHDAQAGFVPPPDPGWQRAPRSEPEVIGHLDLFWTNVIFRDGLPTALIDWELAAPVSRTLDVALAATYWGGVRIDEQLEAWGLPLQRRGERLRILCDGYGLDGTQRGRLLGELIEYRRARIKGAEWRGTTPREIIVRNLTWVEAHASELARFLA